MSRSRDRRYYEDSDDMVERIRRTREDFEKKSRAFQGPDWPYYEKRVIVGQKKKEDMDVAQAQTASATPENTDANLVPSKTGSSASGYAQPSDASAADDTAAWWTAQRTSQKSSGTAEGRLFAADEVENSEDGDAS